MDLFLRPLSTFRTVVVAIVAAIAVGELVWHACMWLHPTRRLIDGEWRVGMPLGHMFWSFGAAFATLVIAAIADRALQRRARERALEAEGIATARLVQR